MEEKSKNNFQHFFLWFGKRNFGVILGIIILLLCFEIYEVILKEEPLYDPFHITEFIFFVVLLVVLGILVRYYIQLDTTLENTMEILNFKHSISLDLMKLDDWDMLIPTLVEIPGKIVPMAASCIQLYNPISGNFELEAEWLDDGVSDVDWDLALQSGFRNRNDNFSLYTAPSKILPTGEALGKPQLEFCLPINDADDLLAIIQFRLEPGETISEEKKLVLESIAPEIALALKANLGQKKLFEFRQTQLALSERHSISNYLHDNLSPNLAFINLKLNQFISGEAQQSIDHGTSELQQMKEAINQSYDIVRKIIETIHIKTTPHLINQIDAQIKKVSSRTRIDISLEKRGTELRTLPETQRVVFNVFQEAMNNLEKHSRATIAKVLVEWGESDLTLKISDNGIGFDPHKSNGIEHLGLEIMQERIESVNGRVDITSAENTGTEVSIFVPLQIGQREITK